MVQLVGALSARQAKVVVIEEIQLAGFAVDAWVLSVNDEPGRVRVLEYPNSAALDADAAKVSPDGFRIGSTAVDWIATPHFYKNAKVIVLYLGCSHDMTILLEATVGAQFAGGAVPPIPPLSCAT